jgi:alpha-beta hydrolase superfamily lysophospholipase
MLKPVLRTSLSLMKWVLSAIGAAALLLTAMVANPLQRPPELRSISETARAVDRSTMPALSRFSARDGTELAYRHYPARGTTVGKIAVLIHGSSGSSAAVHALADALAAHGIETYAPDIRGHGGSGTRGDIRYFGQLDDDMADLVALIRTNAPSEPITLLGHSAGAGFALRLAGSPIKDMFARTILLAPYLGYDAPTNPPKSGGWANPDVPRLIGISILHVLGIDCCGSLPALAFAVSPNSEKILAATYSYRLMRNFATRGYRRDLAGVARPLTLIAGAEDELMWSDKYADAIHAILPSAEVKLIEGVNHMGIVSAPGAVNEIADYVATHGSAGT